LSDSGSISAILPGLLAAAVGVVAMAHAMVFDAPFEDSFITYRYAENLARGVGLVFNPGEIVEGYTSFGWTLLLAGVARCGLPIEVAAPVLSLAFGLGLLGVTVLTARQWMGQRGPWTVAPALLVAANGTWAFYSTTGMETALFALLLGVGVLLAGYESRRSAALAGLALAASALVRPEGLGYFLAVVVAGAFDAGDRRRLGHLAGAFAAAFLPYLAWRWHHYGYPLPNTYYAKASPSLALWIRGLVRTEQYLTGYLFWLAVLAIACLIRRRPRPWRLAACIVAGALANMIIAGGDVFGFYRFLLPAMPAGAIAIAAVLADRAGSHAKTRTRVFYGGGFIALAIWTTAVEFIPLRTVFAQARTSEWSAFGAVQRVDDGYFIIGDFLRRQMSGKTLATNAAGIVPYRSGLPSIDMLGLNDVHIAHAPVTLGTGIGGHEKHDGAYVLARKPDIILLGFPTLTAEPQISLGLSAMTRWARILPGDWEIMSSPIFLNEYSVVEARVAPGQYFMFYERRAAGADESPTRGAAHRAQ
jgi:hypothetical protein